MEELCHRYAVRFFNRVDDPIGPFESHDHALLESALSLPHATFDGQDLYPTLLDKAVTLYYTLNKNHPFDNGNKRLATAALLVFLYINDFLLVVDEKELAEKTLWVAQSFPAERSVVIKDLTKWIGEHLKPKTD